MKIATTILLGKSLRSAAVTMAAVAALAVSSHTSTALAATGDELLMGALPASAMNRSTVDGDTLVSAVSSAVTANPNQAPEIVGAAIPKTRSMATQKSIVRAAVEALNGSGKNVPRVVYAAIKASPNCGNSDGKSGYGKDGVGGCECAEEFTRTAIEALGSGASERQVTDITTAAIQATDGRCADRIVNAASGAAPQYASAIADAGARASRGNGSDFGAGNPDDLLSFSPTGRPIPAPFVFPPATNGGIAVDTTPVN